ncbi:MAG: hypothetical protein P8Y63_15065, partial [Deltaproteobacteria bacterium]
MDDFCAGLKMEVIDPSLVQDLTPEYFNVPAILIDSGVLSQLNEPIEVLEGHIEKTSAPTGLIQEYADDIRMGAMIFNDNGSLAECLDTPDDTNMIKCPDGTNLDGGRLISYIDENGAHTGDLVGAINAIKATSWTPLAEAMYNALGYYTQKASLRLNYDKTNPDTRDFVLQGEDYTDYHQWTNSTLYSAGSVVKDNHSTIRQLYFTRAGGTSNGSGPGDDTGVNWTPISDPVLRYCQNNNILLITEGASTADQNSAVSAFAKAAGDGDGDNDTTADGFCGVLRGSTYFDDLAYYGWHGSSIFANDPEAPEHPRQNIRTYIVTTDDIDTVGVGGNADGECDTDQLISNAAENGGTTEVYSANT